MLVTSSDRRRGLLGRSSECKVLDRLVAGVRADQSQSLVLRGEAGVGKSALLEYLAGSASGCRIARATGVEPDTELAFAGLHQLCAPMLEYLDRLPGPQRAALATAFGLSDGTPPDRFVVGLAVLTLLAEAAEEQPLICLVDDVQWLDRVSASTLAFVARRLLAEPVAMVFAVRDPGDEPELVGLPELVVRGLRVIDARALLASAIPGRLDERVRDRIVAETRGNPLALLELPRGLTAAEMAGGFGRPDARPLASQIEQSFMRRIDSLPGVTQRLLLTAAAEPVGDVSLLKRAADRLEIGSDVVVAAAESGLIEVGAQVRFRHPLVRSAAYRAASPGDRQDVHRALAEVTDPDAEPDRRAWHHANAAVEPDEAVACELERSAGRAQARGGVAAAAAFLRRATELTPDPATRAARAMTAAQACFEAGSPDLALALLSAAAMGPLSELQRARLARLRAEIVFVRRRGSDAPPLLLDAAKRLEPLDGGLAREAYLEALGAAIFAGRLNGSADVWEGAEAARAAPPAPQPPRLVDTLLDGLATRFTDGYAAGLPRLRRAVTALCEAGQGRDDIRRWLWLACPVAPEPIALELWDDEAWHELATRAVELAREIGALAVLPVALVYCAGVHVHAGEFAAATALIEEADAIAEATGDAPLRYTSLLLVAWRGEEARASELIESGIQEATARGEGRAIGLAEYVTAVLNNGLGRYEAALAAARRACEHEDLGFFGWSLGELVEAAVRCGAHEEAAAAMHRLQERTRASGTDWALGIQARSQALLSDGRSADLLYREAIERLARTRVAVHVARAHLMYGEWLRRENRRLDAREQLRTAYDMLRRFGADAFAERARRELLAAGESVRPPAVEASQVLTAQEDQIARLAASGKTNSEIGAQLFISPRTVEWHLHKVFTKLGIDSRGELLGTLSEVAS